MTVKLPIVAALCASILPLSSLPANADRYHYGVGAVQHVITISCYRGPTERVIWDRPNTVFIDSLVNAGYPYADAVAIGERVCRDQAGVGSPETMRATMSNILATNPPRR